MMAAVRAGAACVMTAAGAWGGNLLAGAQKRRADTLAQAYSGVKRLEIEMLEKRMPVREALSACGGLFEETARQMEGGAPPGEAWEAARKKLQARGALLDSLEEGDMTALGRLFGGLGAGGVQAQRLGLNEAAGELERLAGQARKKREEQGKLYASLGSLGGLALALLLL